MRFKILWILNAIYQKLWFGKIGFPSYIGKILFLYGGKKIEIGKKVRIFPGGRFEVHNNGKIIIEDDTSIGHNLHIISSGQTLVVGKHTTISGNVFITNLDHSYQEIGKHIMEQPTIELNTKIGENCFIGFGVAIQAGTILGKQCIVGSNSVVRGTFPDYCVIVGAPARIVKRYNPETKLWQKTDKEGNFI